MGNFEKAEEFISRGIASLNECEIFPSMMNLFAVSRARGRVLNGDQNVNMNELIECQKRNRFRAFDGLIMRHIGEILHNIEGDHSAEAEKWLVESIRADEENQMKWFLAGDHVALAELLGRKGDETGALENLQIAIDTFSECGADGWVRRTQLLLAARPKAQSTV